MFAWNLYWEESSFAWATGNGSAGPYPLETGLGKFYHCQVYLLP